MMVEATAGRAVISASNCASKSAGPASAALAGTSGPHCARNARVAASASASRCGGASGTHTLTWAGPLDCARKSSIHATMSAGWDSTAPIAPMLPAVASAADSGTGQAPAIGASRIGACKAKRRQKLSARSRIGERLTRGAPVGSDPASIRRTALPGMHAGRIQRADTA